MYEKTRLPGPGGILHFDKAQLSDGRSVRVKGSVLQTSQTYQIKLEGVSFVGFRTVFIGGIRDPILISGIDAFIATVRSKTNEAFPSTATRADVRREYTTHTGPGQLLCFRVLTGIGYG